ncbi:hypothetical protein BVX98_01590 [bacterium F11]|nr:hypothetical protein BVX98_01590 [bacterium F11]
MRGHVPDYNKRQYLRFFIVNRLKNRVVFAKSPLPFLLKIRPIPLIFLNIHIILIILIKHIMGYLFTLSRQNSEKSRTISTNQKDDQHG